MGMPDLVAEVVARHVTITDQFEGFHRWLDAPEDVKFLRAYHRHMFQVGVTIKVGHGNRQVEFFQAKRSLSAVLLAWKGKEFSFSCEDLAEQIGKAMAFNGYSVVSVEVSEDGENGGSVEFATRPRVSGEKPGAENWELQKHPDMGLRRQDDEFSAYLQNAGETELSPPAKNEQRPMEGHPGI